MGRMGGEREGVKFRKGQRETEKESDRRRRATERNCPPLLLSIIWESNVSPPRHPREAFWWSGESGDARARRDEERRLRERSEKTHKGSERGNKLTPARENGIPGTECDGNESTDGGDGERRLNNAGAK